MSRGCDLEDAVAACVMDSAGQRIVFYDLDTARRERTSGSVCGRSQWCSSPAFDDPSAAGGVCDDLLLCVCGDLEEQADDSETCTGFRDVINGQRDTVGEAGADASCSIQLGQLRGMGACSVEASSGGTGGAGGAGGTAGGTSDAGGNDGSETSTLECPGGTLPRAFVRTRADVEAIQNCTEATGELVIFAPGDIDLPALQRAESISVDISDATSVRFGALLSVTGSLNFNRNTLLTRIEFPVLETIGMFGLQIGENSVLTQVDVPRLHTAGGLSVETNDLLESFTAPELELIEGEAPAGHVTIAACPSLTRVELPQVRRISDGIAIVENDALTGIDLGAIEDLGSVYVRENPALQDLRLPLVTACGSLDIINNDAMQSFSAPQLEEVSGQLVVLGNAAITTLDVSALVRVASEQHINISSNALLPTCEVDALIAGLEDFTGNVSNNGNGSSCP